MCPVRRSLIQNIAKRDIGRVNPASNGTTKDQSLFPLQEVSITLRYLHGGHAVAQLVEALRYKPEFHGFDSRSMSLDFFIDIILPGALWSSGRLSL